MTENSKVLINARIKDIKASVVSQWPSQIWNHMLVARVEQSCNKYKISRETRPICIKIIYLGDHVKVKGFMAPQALTYYKEYRSTMGSKEKLLVVMVAVAAVTAALPFAVIAAPTTASLAGCKNHCGSVSITYPFGMDKQECYLNVDFRIQCNNSVPYLGDSNIDISKIMLLEGQMRLPMFVGRACYNQFGNYMSKDSNDPSLRLGRFSISNTKNKFVAIGCDTIASVQVQIFGLNGNVSTGCNTQCNEMTDIPSGDCSGIGCCEANIPSEVGKYTIFMATYNFHRDVSSFNNCSYAFVVEEGEFNFSASYLQNFNEETMPVVVDWTVDNKTCDEARKDIASYACGDNTHCVEPNGNGYICKCMEGYDGNPYLSDGCQDINECNNQSLNTCKFNSKCHNTIGNFTCICPKGYHGDGKTACVADRSRSTFNFLFL
ncbi:unnamed protein product [Thlaspi arvense]|uniref:EGF-like domain-containing protein n=1 Tax=Thlaspi arvense TaxID=13288 RepID=A0AAU9RTD3_THLAR|nr:unnamed protein product [Thlaspi arvense]